MRRLVWLTLFCLACAGCGNRPLPVEQERTALSNALGIPSERLEFQGVVSDVPMRGARDWRILGQGKDSRKVGYVMTVYSQVQEYDPGELASDCPFCDWTGPLTPDDAISAARRVASRFWGIEPGDVESESVKQSYAVDKYGKHPYLQVELTFRRGSRRSPWHAMFNFYSDSGVCFRIYARFGGMGRGHR